jgi:hypothetical protein
MELPLLPVAPRPLMVAWRRDCMCSRYERPTLRGTPMQRQRVMRGSWKLSLHLSLAQHSHSRQPQTHGLIRAVVHPTKAATQSSVCRRCREAIIVLWSSLTYRESHLTVRSNRPLFASTRCQHRQAVPCVRCESPVVGQRTESPGTTSLQPTALPRTLTRGTAGESGMSAPTFNPCIPARTMASSFATQAKVAPAASSNFIAASKARTCPSL